jgi:hypothetical protein
LNFFAISGYFAAIKTLNEKIMILKTYYKTKDYCKVKFSFKIEAETVQIRGLNSDWQKSIIMARKKDGSFTADVTLPKDSRHQFKYIVNETEWLNEPGADCHEPNEFGGSNSVIVL